MKNTANERVCLFCGRPESKAVFMVSGPTNEMCLCDRCSAVVGVLSNEAYINKVYENKQNKEEENEDTLATPSMKPAEIKELLDANVIGQDSAKKTLAVAIYNHAKRLNDESGRIKKSNILMVGPSGSGKTLLAQTLAKALNVPFVIADATSLTEAGYAGEDVESILFRLLEATGGNVKLAERGIVFIDEIDKLASHAGNGSGKDISGVGVQHALLKIIEGANVTVPIGGSHKNAKGSIKMNTSNILFICGGAFAGINKKTLSEKTRAVGFGVKQEEVDDNAGTERITVEDLIRFGMIPEFMGRLPIVVELEALTENDLVRILSEPEGAIIKEYIELMSKDNVKLSFTDDALNEIAHLALERKVGARGLRSIVEGIMSDIMFELPSDESVYSCSITRGTVYSKKPVLRRRRMVKEND